MSLATRMTLSQSGPLDVEMISEEFIVMLRQLSYAIKNQLKAPKAPYKGLSCLSLVLYGIRISGSMHGKNLL